MSEYPKYNPDSEVKIQNRIEHVITYLTEKTKEHPKLSAAFIAALTLSSLFAKKEAISLEVSRVALHSPEIIDLYAWYRNQGYEINAADKKDMQTVTPDERTNTFSFETSKDARSLEFIRVSESAKHFFSNVEYNREIAAESLYARYLENYTLKFIKPAENRDRFRDMVLTVALGPGENTQRLDDRSIESMSSQERAKLAGEMIQALADHVSKLTYNKSVKQTQDDIEYRNLRGRKLTGNPITAALAANGEPADKIFSGQVDTAVCRHKAETMVEAFKVLKAEYPSLYKNISIVSLPSPEQWHEYNMLISQTGPHTIDVYGLDATSGERASHADPTPEVLRLMWDRKMINDEEYFAAWVKLQAANKYAEFRITVLDYALNSRTASAEQFAHAEVTLYAESLERDYADPLDPTQKEEFKLFLHQYIPRIRRFEKFFGKTILRPGQEQKWWQRL